MTYEEKNAWVQLVVMTSGVIVYLVLLLNLLGAGPLTEIAYQPALLWCIGGSIVAAIVLRIGVEIIRPSDSRRHDPRDRELARFATVNSQWLLMIFGVAAFVLALLSVDQAWIAHTLYAGFALSSILNYALLALGYRRGAPQW